MTLCEECGNKCDVSLGQTACPCCGAEFPEESFPEALMQTVKASPQKTLKIQSHKDYIWKRILKNRAIQEVFFALVSPKVIPCLIGALIGIACAGLTEPSGYFSDMIIDSNGAFDIPIVSHVSFTVFTIGALVGLCAGVGYRVLRSHLNPQYSSTAQSNFIKFKELTVSGHYNDLGAFKKIYATILLTLISIVSFSLCYMESTKLLYSMNHGNGRITCVTILHHRDVARAIELLPGSADKLEKTDFLALSWLVLSLPSGVLAICCFRRLGISRL